MPYPCTPVDLTFLDIHCIIKMDMHMAHPCIVFVTFTHKSVTLHWKVQVKFTLEQATKAQRGSTGIIQLLSLTLALDAVGSQRHVRYALYRSLGGPQDWSGQVWKTLPHRDSIPGPSSPWRVTTPLHFLFQICFKFALAVVQLRTNFCIHAFALLTRDWDIHLVLY
jgi:hypothetical protein